METDLDWRERDLNASRMTIENKMYPIIHRERRSLLPVDKPPAPVKCEPVQPVVVLADGHQVEPAKSAPEEPVRRETDGDDTLY